MRPTEQGRPDAVLSPERIPSVAPLNLSRAPTIKGRNHVVSGRTGIGSKLLQLGQTPTKATCRDSAVVRWLALRCATEVQPGLAAPMSVAGALHSLES